MTSKFSFMRRVAAGLLAVAIVGGGTSAFAANYTWKGGQTTAARAWATASNWSPSGPPANGDRAFFGPIGTSASYSVNLSADTNELVALTFTSAATGGYQTTGAGAIVVNGAIVNNSTAINPTVGTGESSVVLRNVTLAGNSTLSGTGAPTEIFSNLDGAGFTLTVTGNNLVLDGATATANILASTGSTVSLSSVVQLADFTIGPAGTVGGEPNRAAGSFFATTSDGVLDFQNGSIVNVGVAGLAPAPGAGGDNYDQFTTSGAVTFGGDLNIDWSQVGSSTFLSWSEFDLFSGGTYGGNFSSVTLVGGTSPYAGLTFTQNGGEWRTGSFIGEAGQSQWLVFQSGTGNLVVVPEPSTIVFAGLGVAMSGWSLLKKRRLAKLASSK
jgi:hypothetical protein